ncbi:hypothetical protein [Hydrogenophaga sp. IBVHS1]|uniref:hypothetical protein n=1 Tax=unclassified Hydrogenophaga TaxID=2610897 RepID=UPI000A2DD0A8|nr:hypothetical protein [Hydrogenophaga sp. IBVHS1]OSZ71556.1 hypothetical protein CAP37_20275 [Hydrogenophaga sp. IBVHS1]
MLRVSIHSSDAKGINAGNQLAQLDIAYAKLGPIADYVVGIAIRGVGAVEPDRVANYPRWAGSVWDLVARALTRLLFRADQAPPGRAPDRRCAYTTKLCAIVERISPEGPLAEVANVEILQAGGKRGMYLARFEEDILGTREASFAYGLKSLSYPELLLRAICHAYFGKDTLGPRPSLILPPTMKVDGIEVFDVESLSEPARTGFLRYRGFYLPLSSAPDPLVPGQAYVDFLSRG